MNGTLSLSPRYVDAACFVCVCLCVCRLQEPGAGDDDSRLEGDLPCVVVDIAAKSIRTESIRMIRERRTSLVRRLSSTQALFNTSVPSARDGM